MVLILLSYPYLHSGSIGAKLTGLIFVLIPLSGLHALADNRRHVIIGTVLSIPALAVIIRLAVTAEDFQPSGVSAAILLVYYAVMTGMIFRHLMRSRRVTMDTLFAAASVYMLIGFTFAIAYSTLSIYIPGSIAHNQATPMVFNDFLYFSFVTITTLGYGDMSPATPHARSLAMIESMLGVMYMAIVVARMVSLYRAESDDPTDL